MKKRAIIFNGQVRKPGDFLMYLNELKLLPHNLRPKLVVCSWLNEYESYPEVLDVLKDLSAIIVERTEPNLSFYGNSFNQTTSLAGAISQIEDDYFVLKLRPDVLLGGVIDKFFAHSADMVSAEMDGDIINKIYVRHIMVAEPFLWADQSFAGMATSIRKMTQQPIIWGMEFNKLAAEQWLWSSLFIEKYPAIRAFFTVYPGIIINDFELIEMVYAIYSQSRIFAAAIAAQLHAFNSYCKFFEGDNYDIDLDSLQDITIEEFLWSDLGTPGSFYSSAAMTKGVMSERLIKWLIDGKYRSSPLGDLVAEELDSLNAGDFGSLAKWEAEATRLGSELESKTKLKELKFVRLGDSTKKIISSTPLWSFKNF
jgi:hypothetical protein